MKRSPWTIPLTLLLLLAGCAGPAQPDPGELPSPAAVSQAEPPAAPPDTLEPLELPAEPEAPAPEAAPPAAPETPSAPEQSPAPEPPPAPPEAAPDMAEKTPPAAQESPEVPIPEPLAPEAPEDGLYTAAVTLEGGTGRASVASPAQLRCEDGQFWATIVWSSSNFDYMKVDGVKYELLSAQGSSTFEIPVAAFDQKLDVIADTVAMSEPHEVAYTLFFDSASLQKQ